MNARVRGINTANNSEMKLKSLPISPAVKDALYSIFHEHAPGERPKREDVDEFDLCAGRGTDVLLGSSGNDEAGAYDDIIIASDAFTFFDDASSTIGAVGIAKK